MTIMSIVSTVAGAAVSGVTMKMNGLIASALQTPGEISTAGMKTDINRSILNIFIGRSCWLDCTNIPRRSKMHIFDL